MKEQAAKVVAKYSAAIRNYLLVLRPDERVTAIFDAHICEHCGRDLRTPSGERDRCHCTNDE